MPVQVDDLGREHGAMLGGGVQEPFLVDPDPDHTIKPGRVINHRVRVLGDRRLGGVPTDSELCCRRGDREPVDVHHLGQPVPRPPGQRRPWSDRVDMLGPCAHRAQCFAAQPTAPGEHQHRRRPRDRQIPHLSRAFGHDRSHAPHTTGTTPDQPRSPPTATTRRRAAPAPRRPVRPSRRARSRRRYRDSWTRVSPSADVRHLQNGEALGRAGGSQSTRTQPHTTPHLIA